jgi:hypothetical protein
MANGVLHPSPLAAVLSRICFAVLDMAFHLYVKDTQVKQDT